MKKVNYEDLPELYIKIDEYVDLYLNLNATRSQFEEKIYNYSLEFMLIDSEERSVTIVGELSEGVWKFSNERCKNWIFKTLKDPKIFKKYKEFIELCKEITINDSLIYKILNNTTNYKKI